MTTKTAKLSYYDSIGIEDELHNYEDLLGLGFKEFITYVNPVYVPSLWKKKVGKGPDLILKIGEFTFYIEEKFCSYDYPIRKAWFMKTVVARFRKYEFDYFNRRIVLTNRPQNYNSIKDLVKKFVIKIMNFETLVNYLKEFITLTKLLSRKLPIEQTLNKLTNNNKQILIRVTGALVNSGFNTSFIDSNQLNRVRQSKKLEKLRELKKKYPYLVHIPQSWLD